VIGDVWKLNFNDDVLAGLEENKDKKNQTKIKITQS
jgi:hypothetical protein